MNRRGPVHPKLGTRCHLWTAGLNAYGYGQFDFESRPIGAHVFALLGGFAPPGVCVLHHCDVRRCVNREHLFKGTRGDNTRDMVSKGRQRFWGGGVSGERNGLAKLTSEKVARIRLQHAAGASKADLGRQFGVARSNIHSIVTHRTWV